jgi:hypothetical protein
MWWLSVGHSLSNKVGRSQQVSCGVPWSICYSVLSRLLLSLAARVELMKTPYLRCTGNWVIRTIYNHHFLGQRRVSSTRNTVELCIIGVLVVVSPLQGCSISSWGVPCTSNSIDNPRQSAASLFMFVLACAPCQKGQLCVVSPVIEVRLQSAGMNRGVNL